MCDFNAENDHRSQIVHMKKIQAEGLELFIKKNADYGNSYKQFGLIGVLVRLQDKINRALHVTQNSIQVKDETLRDTLIDLHNYAAMALMEMEPCQQMMFRIRSESAVPNRTVEPPSEATCTSEYPRSESVFPIFDKLTASQRASLPDVRSRNHSGSEDRLPRKSISDPPFKQSDYDSDEAYEECNHRNINLR
jgi:hypothetical protein